MREGLPLLRHPQVERKGGALSAGSRRDRAPCGAGCAAGLRIARHPVGRDRERGAYEVRRGRAAAHRTAQPGRDAIPWRADGGSLSPVEGCWRRTLPAEDRDVESGTVRHAPPIEPQLGAARRVPEIPSAMRLPGGDGRDVRPAGPDVRRSGARHRILCGDGRGHDWHGAVHSASRYAAGRRAGDKAPGRQACPRPQDDRRDAPLPPRREHRRRHGLAGVGSGRPRARRPRGCERHHAEHHGHEVPTQLPALRRQALP